jgi:primosomal protein N'
MRVNVAIALPGAGSFTYEVPAELADAVRPGTRVRVPFGSG